MTHKLTPTLHHNIISSSASVTCLPGSLCIMAHESGAVKSEKSVEPLTRSNKNNNDINNVINLSGNSKNNNDNDNNDDTNLINLPGHDNNNLTNLPGSIESFVSFCDSNVSLEMSRMKGRIS